MQFNQFDADAFLRDHWQKAPLLIRNPWRAWRNPIEPDALAGLACEEGVESRLIMQAGEAWAVEHGPFAEARFETLGAKDWTLLVQAVDHHAPDVAALLTPFRFVPNWRIDDVMVSYAADGGGVGPHIDQYDVFLIQGQGRRRWRTGAASDGPAALLPHDDLRLLADFRATDEWVLEPGDILYLPPGVPHEGVALGGDCMTYSVGFRAPSRSALIAHYCDELLARMDGDEHYRDPDLRAQANPGEIAPAAIAGLHHMIAEAMLDRAAFARWIGEYVSAPKYPEMDWAPDAPIGVGAVRARVAGGARIGRNPASRLAFVRQPPDRLLLFVDGESFECAGETVALAEALCAQDCLTIDPGLAGSEAVVALIAALVDRGSVAFD